MTTNIAKIRPITRRKSLLDDLFPNMDMGRNLWATSNFLDDFFGDYRHFMTDVNFPKYNTLRQDDGQLIEVALAGYSKDDIQVELYPDNTLRISHTKMDESDESDESGPAYIHRGIAKRAFAIEWKLYPEAEVDKVTFKNGMLTIKVVDPPKEKRETKLLEIK